MNQVGIRGIGTLIDLTPNTIETAMLKDVVRTNQSKRVPFTKTLPWALPGFSSARYARISREYSF